MQSLAVHHVIQNWQFCPVDFAWIAFAHLRNALLTPASMVWRLFSMKECDGKRGFRGESSINLVNMPGTRLRTQTTTTFELPLPYCTGVVAPAQT